MKNKSISILILVEISLTFVKSHSKSNDECQQDKIMQMLEFLIDNIFVQSLTPPHFDECITSGPGIPTPYIVVLCVFNCEGWDLVDIGGSVDHHYFKLSFDNNLVWKIMCSTSHWAKQRIIKLVLLFLSSHWM
jgi:hypothetical protein